MKLNIKDWQVLWFFFRSYKLQSVTVLLVMLISGFMDMLNLAALYPILNYGLNVQEKNVVLKHFEQITRQMISDNPFVASCIVLIVLSLFSILFKFLFSYVSNKLLARMIGDTQKRILEKFMMADYDFYVRNQQGKLLYAGTIAVERMSAALYTSFTLIHSSVSALFLFTLLVVLSWQATCAIVLVALLYAAVVKKITRDYVQKCSQVCVQENQRKNVILNELINGIKPIKIFQAFADWRKKYKDSVDKQMANQLHVMVAKVFPEMLVRFLFFTLLAVAGILLSQKPQAELIALFPVFGTFAAVVNKFLPSANTIGGAIMNIAQYIPDAKIVHDMCTAETASIHEGERSISGLKNRITFEQVGFKYRNMESDLLRNVSFSIDRMKMTALVGPSGSGKSTIINLLLKLYRPEKGTIAIDGVDIFEINNNSYLSKFGYVSQETFIFNSTFKENIRFGMENCSDEIIEQAAKLANAHEFIMETPQGYETIVGDSGIKLSGGQRQRVAIARAMLRKPEIIILDEATSSLDNISEKKIQAAINNISKHTTVLVIAHRLSTVQNADKIIILEKGEIKEQGTHEELMHNKDLYYKLHMSKDMNNHEVLEEKII